MKIFCTGLSRTGTSSLNAALEILGFQAQHFPSIELVDGFLKIKQSELDGFDAFTDTPTALLYRELDQQYPGAKFIHTQRIKDEWLASCKAYPRFAEGFPIPNEIRKLRLELYGKAYFESASFARAYHTHEANIEAYFQDRNDDLLKLNICAGANWGPLCRFLGVNIPKEPFPWLNSKGALTNA